MVFIRAAAAALLSGIIVPLYFDPSDGKGCSDWQPLITTLSAQPDLPFYVIINPENGPGSATPDTTYQTCIPTLRSFNSNVKVVGYVATGGGSLAASVVEGDVDLYAAWGAAYRPDGIFFDQASAAASEVATYRGYKTYVDSKTWHESGESFVVLNPGATPDSGYFAIADMIVTFEDFYDNFDITDLTINSASPAAKQAVILHTAPSGTPTDVINELVADNHIGAVFITDLADNAGTNFNPYTGFPTDWVAFVNAVAAASA